MLGEIEADRDATVSKPNVTAGRIFDRLNLENDGELDIRHLLLMLWRRKVFIIFGTAFAVLTSTLIVYQITPQFTANAQVMIETRQQKVANIESVMSGLTPENAAVLSEVEVISSQSLLKKLLLKLALDQDPELNTELQPKPSWQEYLKLETYLPKDWLISLGLRKPDNILPQQERTELQRSHVITEIRDRLSISPVRNSLVISIGFVSGQPRKAALIANTIADLYIVDQLEAKYEATQRATSWLSDRLSSLKSKVEMAERAVERFRARTTDQTGQRSEITTQQLSELNTQVILAQTKRAGARARLEQVKALLESGEAKFSSSSEVLKSPLIHRLRVQEAEVIRKVSELQSRYGQRHPKMIKAHNELRDLRASIEGEVKKIAQSLRNEMHVALARERTLQANLNRLEGKSTKQNVAAVRLRELEREAQANRVLYENFLNRFKETSSQADLQQADARIISRADVPAVASFPNKTINLSLATVAGVLLSVLSVFFIEKIQNVYRSTDELESETGLPVLGIVPAVANILGRSAVARAVVEKPASAAAESVRNISTSINLSDVDHPPGVVAITSTTPSEGKTTFASWLAQLSAMAGKRVLLIDCDLRRPSIHKSLNLQNNLSLVDILSGVSSVEEVLQKDERSGLFVIPGTDVGANAMDLIASENMTRMLSHLRESFDLVILDAPPILAVADARIIARLGDKAVYVVKWNETPKGLVKSGLKVAFDAQIDIAGLVLAQINTKKHAYYGYHDYGYYYGKYKGYYS